MVSLIRVEEKGREQDEERKGRTGKGLGSEKSCCRVGGHLVDLGVGERQGLEGRWRAPLVGERRGRQR